MLTCVPVFLFRLPIFFANVCAGARAGFFLGDGAGVGKGRQIAALIKEYWLTPLLWFNVCDVSLGRAHARASA